MSDLIQSLAVPLQYDYMIRAMGVSALVGGVCGFLSPFVTLKGWSLMGDALSHAVVPGVAVGHIVGIPIALELVRNYKDKDSAMALFILGLPFVIGALVAGLLAVGTMAFIRAQSRIREDATIGIVFTSFFAIGLVLISLFPSGVDLKTILYGNILAIADPDILQVVGISAVTLLVIGFKWRDLMLYCFDPNQARTLGLRAGVLHVTLLALLAATCVAALQAVGAILVLAMLITPGATAYLLTDRFGTMMWLSAAIGVATSLAGAYASYFINGATGGCIVTLQTLVFLAVFVFEPKRGILASRRAIRMGIQANQPRINANER